LKDIIITSSYSIDGYRIVKYIDFISVEVVIGTGIFSEFKASFSDFFGSRSAAFQSKLAKIKSTALQELKEKAIKLNGDAIISIDLDYTNFTQNIIGLIVNGTVVSLVKNINDYNIIETKDELNEVDINCPLYIKSKIIRKQIVKEKIENIFVSFRLLNPKNLDINAIKFIIKLSTFFNESIDSSNQTKIITNLKQQEEQIIQLNIEQCQYDLISHIEVVIEKISLLNQNDWISKGHFVKSNISSYDIYVYQNYFGIDTICYPAKNDKKWTCVCGNANNLENDECSNCYRKKHKVLISKEQILEESSDLVTDEISQIANKTLWNRKVKMHAKINKRVNEDEVEVQNKYGIFTWKMKDCDLK